VDRRIVIARITIVIAQIAHRDRVDHHRDRPDRAS